MKGQVNVVGLVRRAWTRAGPRSLRRGSRRWLWAVRHWIRSLPSSCKIAVFFAHYALGFASLYGLTFDKGRSHGAVEAAYRALRLLTLDWAGMPDEPVSLLGFCYFAAAFSAPLLAAAIGLDVLDHAVSEVVSPVEDLNEHAIVCGFGNHGARMAAWLARHRSQGAPLEVVVVDLADRHGIDSIRLDRGAHKAHLVRGDMLSRDVLERAKLHRARVVIFATGDPLQNLRAASLAQRILRERRQSGPRLVTVVDEPQVFNRVVKAIDRFGAIENDPKVVALPRYGVAESIAQGFVRKEQLDIEAQFVVVGLGRFGRAVLRQLAEKVGPTSCHVVDERLDQALAMFDDGKGVVGRRVTANVLCWIRDSAWLKEVFAEPTKAVRAVFFCLDDDVLNLKAAVMLAHALAAIGASTEIRMIMRVENPVLRGEIDVDGIPVQGIGIGDEFDAWLERSRSLLFGNHDLTYVPPSRV